MTLPSAFKIKRGLAAGIPTLEDGEPGWTTDTHVLYIGQGGVNYAINTGTPYTDEEAQDAVGGILADTDTVNATYTDGTPEIKFDVRTQLSITSDASGVKLSGDSASPGNNYYYGTDSGGTKGYFALPTYQASDPLLDDIAALTDPGADRLLFWDDSDGNIGWLEATAPLSIVGTTVSVTGIIPMTNGGTGSNLSDPGGDRILFWDDSGGEVTWLLAGTGVSIAGNVLSATGTGGTVTSVALTVPSILSVSGSPVTGSGTLAVTLATQAANTIFAGPTNGADAAPTFRAMVSADIPSGIVTDAKISDRTALSVFGRSAATAGVGADIAATNGGGPALLAFNDSTNVIEWLNRATAGVVTTDGSSISWASTIPLSLGGTGRSLADPGADRILFWDDSDGFVTWLTLGSNLSITGTTIDANATIADGDKGDITVSGSGATWTIDANAVSAAKFRQSAALSVVCNPTTSAANVSDVAATNGFGLGFFVFDDSTNSLKFSQSSTAGYVKSDGSSVSVTAALTASDITTFAGLASDDPALGDTVPMETGSGNRAVLASYLLALNSPIPGGRLTLTSGTPITTSDVGPVSTIYYTPYIHNNIALWDGTRWVLVAFTEKSLALGTFTASLPYDLFGYLSAGDLVLEKLAWTNDSTRATAVTIQDGRYCKSGDKTRLYLGTFRGTSTTQTEDSEQYRLLFNHYNRVPRKLRKTDSTASWTYNTAAYRATNNSTANRVGILHGQPSLVYIHVSAMAENSGGGAFRPGIGEDSTTTQGADQYTNANHNATGSRHVGWATLHKSPAVGYHYYQWLEYAVTAGTITWHSDSTMGITGWTMQ